MMEEGEVPKSLKFMVAHVVSRAAGDFYSAAHNAENAAHITGVPLEQIEALPQFATSPLFTPAQRAALALAQAAGASPSSVSDGHFVELRKHFGENAIIEIVSVIALLGWLNRWNVTLATPLEQEAAAFARRHLAP
jgi:alkylhydroperoxidase family enzyme